MLNLPIDHIGLHCSDVELNAKWYQEELGFKVAGKFPAAAVRCRRILKGLFLTSEEGNTTIIRGIAESVKMVCRMQLSDFYGKSWVLRF